MHCQTGETTKILIPNVAAPRKDYVHTARSKPQFRLGRANIQFIITHAGSRIYFTRAMYTTFEKLSVSSIATTEQTRRTLPHYLLSFSVKYPDLYSSGCIVGGTSRSIAWYVKLQTKTSAVCSNMNPEPGCEILLL
jgi:hypothetical protein